MTIEEFIKENWDEFNSYINPLFDNGKFNLSIMATFWIEKSKEFYQSKLEWQPAETAPRDDTKFLGVFYRSGETRIVGIESYAVESGTWYCVNNCYFEQELKYWLPLSVLPPLPE